MIKVKYIAAVVIGIAALGFQAKADDFNFNLTSVNIGGFSGPFIHVDVNRTDSTHATITFTSLTNSGNIYLMGGQGAVGVNVNATVFGLSVATGTNSGTGFTPGPFAIVFNGTEDGFGNFNGGYDSFDGFTHSSDSIMFGVLNVSGTWGSAANVLTGNSQGLLAAAHIFVTSAPADAGNGAINTGYAAGNGTSTSVPDGGATVMLLGAGLSALDMVRRFLKT